MTEKKWSERVKRLADKRGGLEKLAFDLGVSYFTVLRWTKGVHEPSRLAREKVEGLEAVK